MPTTPSASWVAECAACHHSNPARAHFCSVCGAPLQSPAAAAARASAAAAPDAAAGDPPEPKGFMLHFNDDNSLAIAPRYTSPDAGDADTAADPAAHAARQQPHAEFHFSLPGPQPQTQERAQPSASRVNWSNVTVAGAMLALTAIVGSGSYLLGRSSLAPSVPLAGYQAPAPAMATALGTVPAQPAALHTAAMPPGTDAVQPAQNRLGPAQQALAPMAPALPAQPVAAAATVPATAVAQAAPARPAAPQAAAVPGAAARGAPAAMPCNATVAALGLCEP